MTTTAPILSEVLPGVLVVCPADASEDQWLAERNNGIGGSDISAAVGINPYDSPYTLWRKKTGRSSPAPSPEAAERMRWGHILEPVVRDEFARRHPEYIVTMAEGSYARADALWQRVNVDGLVWDRETGAFVGVLECKTGSYFQLRNWEGDQIPIPYTCQGQWACYVTGARRVFFCALLNTSTFIDRPVDRDDDLIDDLIPLGREFWRHVTDDEMPPIDGSEATRVALASIAAREGARVDLDPSWHKGLARRRELHEQIKELTTEKDGIDNQLRAAMGEATEAYLDGHHVATFRPTKTNRSCKYDRLKKKHPTAYAECVTEGEPGGRRLNHVDTTTSTTTTSTAPRSTT